MGHDIRIYVVDDEKVLAGLGKKRPAAVVDKEVAAILKKQAGRIDDMFADEIRKSLGALLGGGDLRGLKRVGVEQALRVLCSHYSPSPRGELVSAAHSFEVDVDRCLRKANLPKEQLSYAMLFNTPVVPGLRGDGDFVVTIHRATKTAEISRLLTDFDFGEAADFREVAAHFHAAAKAKRGVAVFLH